jgi:porphobilinogen deaminase
VSDRPLRVGTRGSALARAQTEQVIRRLRAMHPEIPPTSGAWSAWHAS